MKKLITNYAAYILLAVMLLSLVPGITNRIFHENENDNVVISILYNDIRNKISGKALDKMLDEYKSSGIDTISIMEDDINSMVARGEITSIKHNILLHKYDAESVEMGEMIIKNCPDINYDSHILIARTEETKEKLRYHLPRRYGEKDYAFAGTYEDIDLYVFYDGRKNLWDYAIGYDEEDIRTLQNRGFDIALVHKVKNYANTEYIEDIEGIVKEYGIEYMNLKEDSYKYDPADIKEDNYKKLSSLINKNNMTLVVTENTNQLSNQKFFGYAHVFDETMKDSGSHKVLRSYETYDDSQVDDTFYEYRATQYFNSTIDRNIRFITITQVAPPSVSYSKCAENTLKAARLYKEKIEALGFTVNGETAPIAYTANKRLNAASCAALMVLCLLFIWQMVSGKRSFGVVLTAILLALGAFAGSYILPVSLINLYPTVFCVVQSCFAMTATLYFVKVLKDKLHILPLVAGSLVVLLGTLLLGATGMGSMLSGIGYYINNEIFRGIKLSLIIPILYTAILYYFMYIKTSETDLARDIKKVFNSEIKVYWVLIGGIILGVGVYYIIRSGNVNKISSIEQTLRNTVTEIFPERPRTKEFLIGYPALVLFVYYAKNSKLTLIKWLLAIAASILAASVTNSFCHVFTDFSVIVSRTLNGLTVGLIVSIIAFVANIILIKILRLLGSKLKLDSEMK
ncbi:MAG: hypothetical protein IJ285_04985 [Clostridia bacterium]|nr:hypothetical protein [Clostridia bacterium]